MVADVHVMTETHRTDLPVVKQWIDERDYDAAGRVLTAYLMENHSCVEGWFLFGRLMLEQDNPALARLIYEWLLEQDGGKRWENWLNLGKAWDHVNEPVLAEECYQRALDLDPDNQAALVALGTCYVQQYRSEEAEAVCRKAMELYPSAQWAQSSLGFALLQQRQWGAGWDAYEAGYGKLRWRTERNYRGEPRWDGGRGKAVRMAVHAEQGIGDQIASLEPLADAARDCTVVSVEVVGKLEGLIRRSFPALEVHGTLLEPQIEWPLKLDIGCHAGGFSLHRHYRRVEADYPGKPYLVADPQRRIAWRAILDSLGPEPKIGIAWTGGVGMTQRTARRAQLERLIPILRQPAHFVSLEYKDRSADIAALQRRRKIQIHEFPWATQTDDYDDTAALVAELDLVITVPTAVVHLAGALGTPAWCMVNMRPNIHYTGRGEAIPYYGDTVRLYRRESDDEWAKTANRVARDLEGWLGDRKAA